MHINDELPQRLGASMEALNARIARLAMALDVALNDRAEVAALMATPQVQSVAVERRGTRGESPQVGVSTDRRKGHKREELRGLLVLRYHMETTSLNDNGLTMTRQVLEQAADHLVRQGFKPGADGLALDDLFKTS